MKINYTILLLAVLFYGSMMAQETQKNFINYQGVARNGAGQLMANETMTIGIALKMGSATGAAAYAENHSIGTDPNGVFSIKIGNGETVSGEYNTIPWGSVATFITVLLNGSEIGTTEIMAVPFALSSGDGAQQADEVPYDNSVSGLTATDTQQAIDELVGSGVVDADADPTNEIQDISLAGTDLTISEGSTIDLSAIVPPGGTDDQNAAEVPFDNAASGLAATDAQAAIEELATSGLVDTDDQDLSLSGTTLQITDGTGVDLAALIPPGGTDDQNATEVPYDNTASGITATDAQAAIDELATSGLVDTDNQDLSLSGTTLQITDGASVDLSTIIPPGGTDDQNAAEVAFDNTTSGLAATDTQAAIDELVTGSGSSLWFENLNDIYYPGGNVGIGTFSPSSPLEIVSPDSDMILLESTNSGGDGWIRFNNNTGRVGYIGMFNGTRNIDLGTSSDNPTGQVHLTIGNSPALTVAANGDVGIGTTDPESKLHVAGHLRVENGMFVDTDNRDFVLGSPGNGDRWALRTNTSDGSLDFLSRTSNGSSTTQLARFKLEHSGEVKIGGITENDAWLHLRNNSTVGKPHLKIEELGDDYSRIELTNNRTSSFWHVAGLPANNPTNARLNFFFRNTSGGGYDRMTITGDGKVGINGVPRARLHIYQGGQGADEGLRFSDGINPDWDILHSYVLQFRYGGDVKAVINPITGAYVQSSDRRLKTDIADLGSVLDKVTQLKPSTYRYKSDSANNTTLGLIAQEVKPLFPELVTNSGEGEMLGIDYGAFGVVAIKAIQEQQEIIQNLQSDQKQTLAELSLIKKQLHELTALVASKEVSLKE